MMAGDTVASASHLKQAVSPARNLLHIVAIKGGGRDRSRDGYADRRRSDHRGGDHRDGDHRAGGSSRTGDRHYPAARGGRGGSRARPRGKLAAVKDRALAWFSGADSDSFVCRGRPLAFTIAASAICLAVLAIAMGGPNIATLNSWVIARLGAASGVPEVMTLATSIRNFIGSLVSTATHVVNLGTEATHVAGETVESATTGLSWARWLGKKLGIGVGGLGLATGTVGIAATVALPWVGGVAAASLSAATEAVTSIREGIKLAANTASLAWHSTAWLWGTLRRVASALYTAGGRFVDFVCYVLNLGHARDAASAAASLNKDKAAQAALAETLGVLRTLPPAADVAKAGAQRSAHRDARRDAVVARSARRDTRAGARFDDHDSDSDSEGDDDDDASSSGSSSASESEDESASDESESDESESDGSDADDAADRKHKAARVATVKTEARRARRRTPSPRAATLPLPRKMSPRASSPRKPPSRAPSRSPSQQPTQSSRVSPRVTPRATPRSSSRSRAAPPPSSTKTRVQTRSRQR